MRTQSIRTGIMAVAGAAAAGVIIWNGMHALAQGRQERGGNNAVYAQGGPASKFSVIIGRPKNNAITLSLLSDSDREIYAEYGSGTGALGAKTAPVKLKAGEPAELEIAKLQPNTRYRYRLQSRESGAGAYSAGAECTFQTQRAPGSTFVFGVQGDSHPERPGKMYDPELYAMTMQKVAEGKPDLYFMLGDDFSIERLIERDNLAQPYVDQVYAGQRGFLGAIGTSTALFLVNGNHEQAGFHWLDGTEKNPAVLAGRARNRFYALPAPDSFYTGDEEKVDKVGYLRDYYAFTWGDALFVTIDPYWHSPIGVDDGRQGSKNGKDDGAPRPAYVLTETDSCGETEMVAQDPQDPPRQGGGRQGGGRRGGQGGGQGGGGRKQGQGGGQGGGKGARDMWKITLGDAQYEWLKKTLMESKAKYKFVFAHHVMGTGRGGVEVATGFEWGGRDRRGENAFKQMRPKWEMPIHDLFVKSGVTIFFQGHDHIYAKQELDGVIYQSTPNPADQTYTAFNKEAYRTGTVLPNTGHLRVRVAPEGVKVEYVRSFLKKDETDTQKHGMVADSYTVKAKAVVQ